MIDLKRMLQLEHAGGYITNGVEPINWDEIDIPEDLKSAWKSLCDAKREVKTLLKGYKEQCEQDGYGGLNNAITRSN